MYILIYLGVGVVCGFVCNAISESRGMKSGFWWGFWLGVIGILIVALRPKESSPEDTNNMNELDIARTLKEYKELCDSGVITEEEFANKKEQLLNKESNLASSKETPKTNNTIDSKDYEKLVNMKEQGIISDSEFEKLKNE